MDKKFEPGRIVRNRDLLNKYSIDLDNGEVQAHLDLFTLRTALSHAGISQVGIINILRKLERYCDEVETGKAKGIHVGSSSLANGFESEIWVMSPQELGLQTETEVKLVATLVGRLTQDSR